MLAMYVTRDPSHWDVVPPFVTFAYSTVAKTTTIFLLFFPSLWRRAVSHNGPTTALQPWFFRVPPSCLHSTRSGRVPGARPHTDNNGHGRDKRLHDNDTSSFSLLAGTFVWLWIHATTPGLSFKWLVKCRGPYLLIKDTSRADYILQPLTLSTWLRCRSSETIHVSRLKPYNDPAVVPLP